MTRREPRVHMMDEGGVLVLGTDDVATARAVAQQYVRDDVDGRYAPDGWDEDQDETLAMLDNEPRTGFGHCVPVAPGSYAYESEGWRWMWYAGHGALGKPGTTRYVEWYPAQRGPAG